MTIPMKCEVLASDYLFLRDKLKELHTDAERLEKIQKVLRALRPLGVVYGPTPVDRAKALGDSFIQAYLRPPFGELIFPNIPKPTLQRLEQEIRDAVAQPLDRIPLELDKSIAEFQGEMWQEVATCSCELERSSVELKR